MYAIWYILIVQYVIINMHAIWYIFIAKYGIIKKKRTCYGINNKENRACKWVLLHGACMQAHFIAD